MSACRSICLQFFTVLIYQLSAISIISPAPPASNLDQISIKSPIISSVDYLVFYTPLKSHFPTLLSGITSALVWLKLSSLDGCQEYFFILFEQLFILHFSLQLEFAIITKIWLQVFCFVLSFEFEILSFCFFFLCNENGKFSINFKHLDENLKSIRYRNLMIDKFRLNLNSYNNLYGQNAILIFLFLHWSWSKMHESFRVFSDRVGL